MQIIPIRDLKDTSKVSEMCNLSNEPIFVTKNGYGDLVVMSMKTYQTHLEETLLLERLNEMEKGELLDGKEVFKRLREKYAAKI